MLENLDISQLLQYLQPDSAEAATPTTRPTQANTSGPQALQQLKQVMELTKAMQQQQINQKKIEGAPPLSSDPNITKLMAPPTAAIPSPGLAGDVTGGGDTPITYGRNPRTGAMAFNNLGYVDAPGSEVSGRVADIARGYSGPQANQSVAQAREMAGKIPQVAPQQEALMAAQLAASLKSAGVPESIVKQIVHTRFPSMKSLEQESKQREIRETKAPERENKLSDDFRAESKQFVTARDSFSRIQASAKQGTPAGDLSMIYAYMKMLDPGSVVRESEFRQAQTARPLLERMGLNWDALQSVWAGQKMTPSMRQDFIARANDIYDEAQKNQQEIYNIYAERAKRMGLEPENVVIDYNKGVKRETAPSSGKVRPMKEFNDAMTRFKGDRAKVREYFLQQGVTEFK